MSRLSADAKEFIYPGNPQATPLTGTHTSYVMRRLQENREVAPVSVPVETLSHQQSRDRDSVAVDSTVHADGSMPQFRSREEQPIYQNVQVEHGRVPEHQSSRDNESRFEFNPSSTLSRSHSNTSSAGEQFLMQSSAKTKVLEEFQSTVQLLANDPGQYNAVLEFLLLILEPYFHDKPSMEFVAEHLITTGWDTNFQYLAAKLAKEFDEHSNYFRSSLVEAINKEVNGEILEISSFTLLVSELFVVFPAEFVNLLYKCISKLLYEDDRFDFIKTICKVLKLNAQSLEAYNSVEYVNVLRQLKSKRALLTNEDTKKFIDITLSVIETRDSRHLNGNSHLQNGGGNVRDRLPNRPITNSQFIAHHDHGYSAEDCEYGGIIYGPDSQPMTEDEMAFLESAAVEAELVDEFNNAFNE